MKHSPGDSPEEQGAPGRALRQPEGSTASSKEGMRSKSFSCQRGCIALNVEQHKCTFTHQVWTLKTELWFLFFWQHLNSGIVSGALWSSEKGPGLQNAWGGCG